jgi:hypothetical protein
VKFGEMIALKRMMHWAYNNAQDFLSFMNIRLCCFVGNSTVVTS